MKVYLEFITTPTADTPGSCLLLHFDDKRYIFGNISEGTQRACGERGIRLVKVTDMFLTGTSTWSNHGGLMGLLLTLADVVGSSSSGSLEAERLKIQELKSSLASEENKATITRLQTQLKAHEEIESKLVALTPQKGLLGLHGGPNLTHTIATGRTYICRTEMPCNVHEFGNNNNNNEAGDGNGAGGRVKDLSKPTWSDDHLKVWALPVYPSGTRSPGGRRKRSLDEFQETAAETTPEKEQGTARSHHDDQVTRQAVVSEMFNSQWRMDALVETPIAEVSMPATLFIRDPDTQEVLPYTGPKPGGSQPLPNINVLVRKPWPGAMVETLPTTSPSECSMSYIIRNHDSRGKFDAKKAAQLNVKKGPNFKMLTMGQSVQSIDGRTITPDMVLGERKRGKGVALIDLPTTEYIENLVNRPEWESPEAMEGVESFIWLLGSGVGGHPRLQEFVLKMSKYHHVVSAPDYCPNHFAFRGAATSAIEFSQLDSSRYQTPVHDDKVPNLSEHFIPETKDLNVTAALPGMMVDMEPKFKVIPDPEYKPLDIAKIKEEVREDVLRNASLVQEKVKSPEFLEKVANQTKDLPGGDAEIITLGTGSSLPSRFRNVSGTLLRVPGYGNYLFDAGEGTLGQLKRVFNAAELKEVLRDLRVIWISHLHADHHLGTVSVIKAWYEEVYGTSPPIAQVDSQEDVSKVLNEKRLYVVSAMPMLDWLAEYASVENYGYDKIVPLNAYTFEDDNGDLKSSFLLNHREKNGRVLRDSDRKPLGTRLNFESKDSPLTQQLQSATGLSNILTVPVSHCHGANAVSIVFPSGFKVSYSGDCRPSVPFTKIGRGSTVLLHEATFDDNMVSDAIAKRHSTVSEAYTVGRKMGAKVIVLTHFSQRYREMTDETNAKEVPIGLLPGRAPLVNAVRDIPVSHDTEGKTVVTSSNDPAVLTDAAGGDSEPSLTIPPVVVSFDYMRLRVADALYAEAHQPVIRQLLAASSEDADDKGKDGGSSKDEKGEKSDKNNSK